MPACHCLLCYWQKCNIRNNGQKGGGQEIRERDCGLTPEVITLDRLGLMLAHHDRCHSKTAFLTWLLLPLLPLAMLGFGLEKMVGRRSNLLTS